MRRGGHTELKRRWTGVNLTEENHHLLKVNRTTEDHRKSLITRIQISANYLLYKINNETTEKTYLTKTLKTIIHS